MVLHRKCRSKTPKRTSTKARNSFLARSGRNGQSILCRRQIGKTPPGLADRLCDLRCHHHAGRTYLDCSSSHCSARSIDPAFFIWAPALHSVKYISHGNNAPGQRNGFGLQAGRITAAIRIHGGRNNVVTTNRYIASRVRSDSQNHLPRQLDPMLYVRTHDFPRYHPAAPVSAKSGQAQ